MSKNTQKEKNDFVESYRLDGYRKNLVQLVQNLLGLSSQLVADPNVSPVVLADMRTLHTACLSMLASIRWQQIDLEDKNEDDDSREED
ncbi:hypothetical protein [Bifidobacterium tissieri]|uniref:hypothetical protein n=1 Tax=Bifidobacterium tissieri TaxID=1630162 RepID=UPI00123BB241|nr:hypothetical protein [Bifidobacterium tissieri]KAA8832586.1 hypothetical protein EM849_03510 [Bifidobacterium tissieri]